jgi:nucleoside phosphorylase
VNGGLVEKETFSVNNRIDLILVSQGQEYKAIARGLSKIDAPKPMILPVPMGTRSLQNFLEQWQTTNSFSQQTFHNILLMGLCGSLLSQFRVGDVVIYRDCSYASTNELEYCDRQLTQKLEQILSDRSKTGFTNSQPINIILSDREESQNPDSFVLVRKFYKTVRGLTSDRLIWSAEEKRQLGKLYDADVVDMEGFIALKTIKAIFSEQRPQIAIVRVVSDDCDRDIPNLEGAIDANGKLQPLYVATSFLQQPIAAIRLIQGSIKGLRVLEKLTTEIFS